MKTMNFKGEENDNSESNGEAKSAPLQIDDSTLNEVAEAVNTIDFATPEKIAKQKVKELEEDKQDRTPKTGKKSARALKGEEKEKLLGVTRSFVNGINEVLVNRLGENFQHEKEEIDTYSVLVFALVEKHFPDIAESQYAEEAALAMYAFGQETPRILNYIEERNERKENERIE